jgi:hypothetical protein
MRHSEAPNIAHTSPGHGLVQDSTPNALHWQSISLIFVNDFVTEMCKRGIHDRQAIRLLAAKEQPARPQARAALTQRRRWSLRISIPGCGSNPVG